MRRRILVSVINFLFRLLVDIEVKGLENIPHSGGVIFAPNHFSLLDSALILILTKRQDLTGMVADKYKKKFWISFLVNTVNGIWLNRESSDFQALRKAIEYLKAGGALGIAPEGTRSKVGYLIPAKTGVAYIAEKAKVPVLPIAIYGTGSVFSQIFRLRRPKAHIQFGKLLEFPPVDRKERSAALERNTEEIMCQIAAMLPPAYRGHYADNPRTLELLAGQ